MPVIITLWQPCGNLQFVIWKPQFAFCVKAVLTNCFFTQTLSDVACKLVNQS